MKDNSCEMVVGAYTLFVQKTTSGLWSFKVMSDRRIISLGGAQSARLAQKKAERTVLDLI